MTKKERYTRVIEYFEATRPDAAPELQYNNPFELLVAVILSAQCTDKRVNQVTPALFSRFPTAQCLAAAEVSEVYGYVNSVSYPNSKSQHLVGMAQGLCEMFGGEVPADRDKLMLLPGVGRKTANVIASVVFHQPVIAVDTHVFRVSARIGLTRYCKTPEATELELEKNVPGHLACLFHHWLILHGRYVCLARRPKCQNCGLTEVCVYYAAHRPQTTDC